MTAIAYDSRARHDTKSVVRTIRERFRLSPDNGDAPHSPLP
ncbi:hypothetical protein LA76x_2217 [Lysobacter antibioticus]|uniref:Uncharacterized protein n=1 Tax=Lysobacter antibioticus TaxID=84531 RepID=A0A0S2F9Z9_LYSAN|nr:hypothetical protein LA76x_2217 [Lysobacter antibioticus]